MNQTHVTRRLFRCVSLFLVLTLFAGFLPPAFGGIDTTLAADSNLARGKAATASSYYSNNSTYAASRAVDGDATKTRWSAAVGDATPWIMVDLGSDSMITSLVINEYQSRIKDYKVEYSSDGTNWIVGKSGSKATSTTDTTTTIIPDGSSFTGRYVKLSSTTPAVNGKEVSIYELQIWGSIAVSLGTNLASGATALAGGVDPAHPDQAAGLAVDGNGGTRWTGDGTTGQWLQVDLGREAIIDKVRLKEFQSRVADYRISYSLDGTTWLDDSSRSKSTGITDTSTLVVFDNSVRARYVKLSIQSAAAFPSLYEFEVYGAFASLNTVNLALGKTTSASSTSSVEYRAKNATDESMNTRWEAANGTSPQWLQIDLGSTYIIDQLIFKEYQSRITSYSIQYSLDGLNWKKAVTGGKPEGIINATIIPKLGGEISGRYVRLDISTATGNPAIQDVEVYGKPASLFTRNAAFGKPAAGSSASTTASNAFDENPATRWTAGGTASEWLQVDLGDTYTFDQIVLQEYKSQITSFTIRYSKDGAAWQLFKAGVKLAGETDTQTIVKLDNPVAGRYVKLEIDAAASAPSIYDMLVYGGQNLALGSIATASSVLNRSADFAADRALDGNAATRWVSSGNSEEWLQAELPQTSTVNFLTFSEQESTAASYTVQYSEDGMSWKEAATGTKSTGAVNETTVVPFKAPVTGRYFKIVFGPSAAGSPSVSELALFGYKNKTYKVLPSEGIAGLNAAMAMSAPGDTIMMGNGIWSSVKINLSASATAESPVTLRAETPGQVIINGSSTLTFSSPFLVADGLYFKGGALTSGSIVTFASDYGRLSNSAIEDYNPPSSSTSYYWVFFDGSYNRLDHTLLKGKNHIQPLIGNQSGTRRYNKADHNYIKDIPLLEGINGAEIFRIWGYGGNEELGDDGAFFTIESNLFERASGEGQEIISLKSNRNVVQYNTIVESVGEINNRSGNYNTIRGNYIFGNNVAGTGGIRISGQSHTVVNNYIEGIDKSGLSLTSGEYIDTYLTPSWEPTLRDGTPLGRVPRYGPVKNGVFAHNSFVNVNGYGIDLSWAYKGTWPAHQRVMFPENNVIADNIITKAKGSVTEAIYMNKQDTAPPLNIFTFQPNILNGNIVYGGAATLNRDVPPIRTIDPGMIVTDNVYKPYASSPAVNGAVGAYVTEDIEGRARDGRPDIGAFEATSASATRGPLTAADVGPDWINKPPVLNSIESKTISEGSSLQFAVRASDKEGDPIAYTADGLPKGASFDATTGLFTWKPGYDQAGDYYIRFAASDGKQSTAKRIQIKVTATDTPPVFDETSGPALTVTGSTATSVKLAWKPAVDNIGITGYKVFRGEDFLNTVTTRLNGTVTDYVYGYEATGLTPGTSYTFSVQAIDTAGSLSNRVQTTGTTLPIMPSGDAALSSLVLSGFALNPAFDPGKWTYDARVPNSVSSISMTATAASSVIKSLTIAGKQATSGSASQIAIQVGVNPIDIVVTAQSGATATYSLNILRVGAQGTSSPSASGSTVGSPSPAVVIDGSTIKAVAPVLDAQTGAARLSLDKKMVEDAFEKAESASQPGKVITIDIPKVEGARSYALFVPAEILAAADENHKISIKTELGSVIIPLNMLSTSVVAGAKEVGIHITAVNAATMTGTAQQKVGSRPVVDLYVTVDGKKTEFNKPEVSVTVSIPYKPSSEESANPEHIVILYVDDAGQETPVTSGKYDAGAGAVTFQTTHFRMYAIAYVIKSFADIKSYDWATKQIEVLASKGVINGRTETTFDPGANVTRAEFTVLLVKALGLNARTADTFTDVSTSDYYFNDIAVAKALGIVNGRDNGMFDPHKPVSRQEMITMAARALKTANTIGSASDLSLLLPFRDRADVADYAANSMASLVKEGLVQGSGDMLHPLAPASRAETAVLMYRIYNK